MLSWSISGEDANSSSYLSCTVVVVALDTDLPTALATVNEPIARLDEPVGDQTKASDLMLCQLPVLV